MEGEYRNYYKLVGALLSHGRFNSVGTLLANGMDVNSTGPYGDTAAHVAARCGFEDYFRELIANGARLDIKDSLGTTAYQIAIKSDIMTLRMAARDCQGPRDSKEEFKKRGR